ncbi:MAG: nuclear transport factor 2 family protein [Gemmatimonadota bacterium]|nr:nuclear transport factor 2 family protein [Gemmatimonadota bacterium]
MSRALGSSRVALVAALIALGVAGPSPTAQAQTRSSAKPSATERELYRIEDAWAQAVVRRDAKALGRLIAPRWVYSDESGLMDRDAGMAAFVSGSDTVTEASNADMRANVYGNAAVVTGILRMKGRGPSGPFDRRYRYTDTWVRMDGRWQAVASQDYLMPEKKP